MTPLKQQISPIPFLIEHWYSPYKWRHFKNRSDETFCILLIKDVLSVHLHSRITDERGNGRRPNLAFCKRWPCRNGWLMVVIRICAWILVFYFLHHWGIGDFPTFVSISLFSQFSYNKQPIWTKLGKTNDADECIHNFGTDIQRTSKSILIRIRIRITFVSNCGVSRGLHSLLQTEHL